MATITTTQYIDTIILNEENNEYYQLEINHNFELISSYWENSDDADPGLSHARHPTPFSMNAQIYYVSTSNTRTAVGCSITGPGQYSTYEYASLDDTSTANLVYDNAEGINPSNVFITNPSNPNTSATMKGNYFDLFPGSGVVLPNLKEKATNVSSKAFTNKVSTIPNYYDADVKSYSRLEYKYAANSDFIDVVEFNPNTVNGVIINYTMAATSNDHTASFTVPLYVDNDLDYSRDFITELVARAKQALWKNVANKAIQDIVKAPQTVDLEIPGASDKIQVMSADRINAVLYVEVPVLNNNVQIEAYKNNVLPNTLVTNTDVQAIANVKNVSITNTEFQAQGNNSAGEGYEPGITTTSANVTINTISIPIPTIKG